MAAGDKKYELKLPDGAAVDAAVLERTAAFARPLGLSSEHAQSTLAFVNQEVATAVQQARTDAIAAHQPGGAEWTKVVDGWKAQTLKDEALGKTDEERKAAIQRGHGVLLKYTEAHPDRKERINKFLNDSGLGDHPDAVHLFVWLGKAAGEGTFLNPGSGASGNSEDAVLAARYPSMVKTA